MKVFPNKKLKQINFLDERYYECPKTGLYFPSVTHILGYVPKGMGFMNWLKQNGMDSDKIRDEAAAQGTRVHNGIEKLLKGEELKWEPVTDDVMNLVGANYSEREWYMLLRFKDFMQEFEPNIIAVEYKMVDHELRVGGTLDLVAEVNGTIMVIDHKTSNYLWDTSWAQIEVYRRMWNNHHKEEYPATESRVLHLCSDHKGPRKGYVQGQGWVLRESPLKRGESRHQANERFFKMFAGAQQFFDNDYLRIDDIDGKSYYKPKNKVVPDTIKIEPVESKVKSPIT